jgi:hypothetical protein
VTRTAEAPRPARWAEQLPDPGRFWIRYVPRAWEPPEPPWVHLAEARLGEWGRTVSQKVAPASSSITSLEALQDTPLDDVLYLPPVPPRRAAARDKLASSRLVDGTPVLLQLFPGDESTVPAVSGVAFVFELLPALLAGDLARLDHLPAGSAAVWPLIPGLTDDPELWEAGCARLAAAGVRCVQAMAPALEPSDRRRLAERWGKEREEEVFDALFHREPPPERDFARRAHRHGLEPFLPRPLPRAPVLRIENRRLGGALAFLAELWLRLGKPEVQGQAFYQAARWIDRTTYDVAGLEREGNLSVLPFDSESRAAVAELLETGESGLLAALLAEYVAPDDTCKIPETIPATDTGRNEDDEIDDP